MDVLPPTDSPVLVQWLLDTRPLWPEAMQTRQLETVAARALAVLLSDEERAGVLKYYFVRDAKMALASLLIKHLVVARCGAGGGVPWQETVLSRDGHGKPIYVGYGQQRQPVVFNVSHQAGIVVLVAVYRSGGGRDEGDSAPDAAAELCPESFQVGVDVVSPTERRKRDREMIAGAADGWPRFVDMHADVLAPGEVRYLKTSLPPLRSSSSPTSARRPGDLTDTQLDYFYALWCLREAYVKMTGEALLAAWLADLEFFRFQPPPEAVGENGQDENGPESAALLTAHDIRFRGRPVGSDVNLCLRRVGADHMVCTAVRAAPGQSTTSTSATTARDAALALPTAGAFEVLRIDDILDFAEHSLSAGGV